MKHLPVMGSAAGVYYAQCARCGDVIWDATSQGALTVLMMVSCFRSAPWVVECITCRRDATVGDHNHLDLLPEAVESSRSQVTQEVDK